MNLDNGDILANFPSEGFRLKLKLVDEGKREEAKRLLMRPRKDLDLTHYFQLCGMSSVVWMGYRPEI